MTGIKVEDFIRMIDKLENEGVLSRKLSRDLERQFVSIKQNLDNIKKFEKVYSKKWAQDQANSNISQNDFSKNVWQLEDEHMISK